MLKLIGCFWIGFASDFLVVNYYRAISADRIWVAVACNLFIFAVNAVFVVLVQAKNGFQLCSYLIGQSIGIIYAMRGNEVKN